MRWLISLSSASSTRQSPREILVDAAAGAALGTGGAIAGGGGGGFACSLSGVAGTLTSRSTAIAGAGFAISGAFVSAGATPSAGLSNFAVNQKRLPTAGSLSTPISPPSSSTSCLEIESPSPVPPYFRVLDPST